jgi:DNA-binding NtrC family response regulator
MTQSNQKEVLIVEDEAMIRMVAVDALADRGIVAWEAGDAEEALDALDEHPSISLLFTDVNMPGEMNGIDLARRVHEVRPDVELIVTSGATIIANDDLPDHGTFLGKPYPMDRLVQIVAMKLDPSSRT